MPFLEGRKRVLGEVIDFTNDNDVLWAITVLPAVSDRFYPVSIPVSDLERAGVLGQVGAAFTVEISLDATSEVDLEPRDIMPFTTSAPE